MIEFEFTNKELEILIDALSVRKSKADRRKFYYSSETQVSLDIAPLLKRLKNKINDSDVPLIIVNNFIDEQSEEIKAELIKQWKTPKECIYGCGLMELIDPHNKRCPICGFSQWSTIKG